MINTQKNYLKKIEIFNGVQNKASANLNLFTYEASRLLSNLNHHLASCVFLFLRYIYVCIYFFYGFRALVLFVTKKSTYL